MAARRKTVADPIDILERDRRQARAFHIIRLREDYFMPVLIDGNDYPFFEQNICACADQAASTATRSGTRPLEYRGMFTRVMSWENGRTVSTLTPIEDDLTCNVDPKHWTWQHHGHTHGLLGRCSRPVEVN